MAISAEAVKELRDKTGVSMMECKKALEEAGGDMTKAMEVLGKRAAATAAKKADRALGAGTVASYIHNQGQVGAMIVLACETDFVSKNEEFVALARDLAMHAAAMRPQDVAELLTQPFIKNPDKTVANLVSEATQKFGERTEISQMACFSVR
jgi:elongation factor Ts